MGGTPSPQPEPAFLTLFDQQKDRVDLRVFAEKFRDFYVVSVKEVCEVFKGTREFAKTTSDDEFEFSTARFIRTFDRIQRLARF